MRVCVCVRRVSVYAHIFQCIARLSSSNSMCVSLCLCMNASVSLCGCLCVPVYVCVNVCLCLFVVSTRQTFENIYFSPCDNATFLAQLALPAETEFSIQLSMLCSLSPPLSFFPSIIYALPFPFYDYFLSPPLFGFYCWLTAAHPVRFAWIGLV